MYKTIFLVISVSIVSATSLINVPSDYSTIQEGINAATTGDTVLVVEGEYFENIILEKEIVLASHAIYDNLDDNWLNNQSIIGTKINGRLLGTFSDAAIFSFELSKTVSFGWGGLLIINNNN